MPNLMTALRNADAAGDVESAKRIAAMIKNQQSQPTSSEVMNLQDLLTRNAKGEQGLIPEINRLRQLTGNIDTDAGGAFQQSSDKGLTGQQNIAKGLFEGVAQIGTGATELFDKAFGNEPNLERRTDLNMMLNEGDQSALRSTGQFLGKALPLAVAPELGLAGMTALGAAEGAVLTQAENEDATAKDVGVGALIGGGLSAGGGLVLKKLSGVIGGLAKAKKLNKIEVEKALKNSDPHVLKLGRAMAKNKASANSNSGIAKALKFADSQGVDDLFKASLTQANKETNQVMQIMAKDVKRAMVEPNFIGRPSKVLGDVIGKKYDLIQRGRRNAGKKIAKMIPHFKGRVDGRRVSGGYLKQLKDLNIVRNDSGALDFTASKIGGLDASENFIKRLDKKIGNTDLSNPEQLHNFKKWIDTQVSHEAKQIGGFDQVAESLAKNVRSTANKTIGSTFKHYAKENAKISKAIKSMDKIESLIGKKNVNLDSKSEVMGLIGRRMDSNTLSGSRVADAMESISDTAKIFGDKTNVDIKSLSTAVDMFQEAGLVNIRGALKGQAKQGMTEALKDARPLTTKALDLVIDSTIGKINPVTLDRKLMAIERLLKESNK